MADLMLTARNALPQGEVRTLAGTRIEVLAMRRLTSLMPGRDAAPLRQALKKHHGLVLPEPGQCSRFGEAECLWFGRDQYLLIGEPPSPLLAGTATMTDQSDAWTSVLLEGPLARAVLARLTPLDLRDRALPEGASARSEIAHMQGALTRVTPDGYRLMVFRSMAETLLRALRETLETVAARQAH
ncbi:sarcosine oxidase subunit gamma [Oceanicola sp. S124]|uniref:sarcosine oxidase subunit gamma n=1 Tax=Oceanicola sp. S124 TaxID=1042378 RepID=UPI0002557ED6|nr:sarcosine oxidase subunit gamma [Oceanicola sp. S124]